MLEKQDPEELYKDLKAKIKERNELNHEIELEICNYRIKSVARVLRHIRDKKLTENELDNKIVHCLNKLNGNIDGIELELKPWHTNSDGNYHKS